eukprot:scaffold101427_cov38-Tisochrysis_lutea.AAC.3
MAWNTRAIPKGQDLPPRDQSSLQHMSRCHDRMSTDGAAHSNIHIQNDGGGAKRKFRLQFYRTERQAGFDSEEPL